MMYSIFLAVLLPAMSVYGQLQPTQTYTHVANLTNGNVYWKVDGDVMTIEVHMKTTGWVGVGISPNGGMAGADIFVGWVKEGFANITDRHGPENGNGFPEKDAQQNVNISAAAETDGYTLITFSRELAACETDDLEITSSTTKLIWAFGEGDPSGENLTASDIHTTTNRGVVNLYLLDSDNPKSGCSLPNGPEYRTHDLVVDRFPVPAQNTYYNCRLLEMPRVTGKRHIVEMKPIVQNGNENYVHHILLYQCADDIADSSELNKDAECYGTNPLNHFQTCTSVITAWAIGGSDFCLPDEAGFAFGGDSDGPVIVKIEIHYDNPNSISGIVDSSGIRIMHTDTIRENDAGLMQVGNKVNGALHLVPPGAESYLSVGLCAGTCIHNVMNSEGVNNLNIFAVMQHAHLAGRKLRLRHIRSGVELPYIADDENYDFNYQETRYLLSTVQFNLGDSLRMECEYNTEGRTTMTEGGLGTTNEMCMSFVWYYPRIAVGICESVPSEDIYAFFGIADADQTSGTGNSPSHYTVTSPPELNGITVLDVMNDYAWTEEQADAFSLFAISRNQQQSCRLATGTAVADETISTPAITSTYTVPAKTCSIDPSTLAQNLSLTAGGILGNHESSRLLTGITLAVVLKILY